MSIIQATRYRQWPLVFSSIGYTIALVALPNIQNYAFQWVVFTGGHFDWGAEYSWQTGQMDPYWCKILLALLGVELCCAGSLWPFLASLPSKLDKGPSGLETVAELVLERGPADFGLDMSDEEASFNEIASILRDRQFRIVRNGNFLALTEVPEPTSITVSQTQVVTPPQQQSRRLLPWGRGSKVRQYLSIGMTRLRSLLVKIETWLNRSPYPFLFHPVVLMVWISFLCLVLAASSYVIQGMTTPQQLIDQIYALPWNPTLYIAVGVSIQVQLNQTSPQSFS